MARKDARIRGPGREWRPPESVSTDSCIPDTASAPRPVTVYLDTQDFSRFADAAAGRPREPADVDLLATLEAQGAAGRVRFVYSAMHLSELLQFDGGGSELTLRKAAMVERLCGSKALLHPGRLLALQAIEAAQNHGLPVERTRIPTAIGEDNDWHPSISATLVDLRAHLDQALDRRVAALGGNRRDRMAARAKVRRLGASLMSEADIERISRSYPFSPDVMRRALRAAMDGRRPTREDERDFFREFAQPTRFVQIYFERKEGEKTLQRWMRDFGEQLRGPVAKLRDDLVPHLDQPGLLELVRARLKAARLVLPRKLLSDFADEVAAMGLSATNLDRLLQDDGLLVSLPFCRLLADLVPAYVEGNVGVHAAGRAARSSAGGDILHAIALPYCDLVRTDAYFGDLLKRVAPDQAGKVVPRLQDVPRRIEDIAARAPA